MHSIPKNEIASYEMLVMSDITFFNSTFIAPLLLQPSAKNRLWDRLLSEHISILNDSEYSGQQKANKLSIKKFYRSVVIALAGKQAKSFTLKVQRNKPFVITDEVDSSKLPLDSRMDRIVRPSEIKLLTNLYCIKT